MKCRELRDQHKKSYCKMRDSEDLDHPFNFKGLDFKSKLDPNSHSNSRSKDCQTPRLSHDACGYGCD
jgi:hypothetical protein